jgi:hypothetical protein
VRCLLEMFQKWDLPERSLTWSWTKCCNRSLHGYMVGKPKNNLCVFEYEFFTSVLITSTTRPNTYSFNMFRLNKSPGQSGCFRHIYFLFVFPDTVRCNQFRVVTLLEAWLDRRLQTTCKNYKMYIFFNTLSRFSVMG